MAPEKMEPKENGGKIGFVSNIQKFSVNDGYGIRTVIFLLGCTLRCKWCQNPEMISLKPALMFIEHACKGCGRCKEKCPYGAPLLIDNEHLVVDKSECNICFKCVGVCPYEARRVSGKAMTSEQVVKEVLKDEVFYKNTGGGITISGGEPLLQIDFTLEILKMVKPEMIGTSIETAGNVPWSHFEKVISFVDLFLYDIKLNNDELHKKWTGESNKLILSNLNKLATHGKEIIIRIPLIPNVNDGQEFENIVNYVTGIPSIKEIHILPFHQLGRSKYEQLGMQYCMEDWKEDNLKMIKKCENYSKIKGLKVSVGGSGF